MYGYYGESGNVPLNYDQSDSSQYPRPVFNGFPYRMPYQYPTTFNQIQNPSLRRPMLNPYYQQQRGTNNRAEPTQICIRKLDARTLFHTPGRNNRPPKVVILIRGLPGSGKTYLSKLLKDAEIRHSDNPSIRQISMDDYYMVEKTETVKEPGSKQSRTITKLEYEYEEGMEETYRESMAKALGKYLKSGVFNMIIVEDCCPMLRNLYEYRRQTNEYDAELYILHASGGDDFRLPALDYDLILQRNVHNRSKEAIDTMWTKWQALNADFVALDAQGVIDQELKDQGNANDAANNKSNEVVVPKQEESNIEDNTNTKPTTDDSTQDETREEDTEEPVEKSPVRKRTFPPASEGTSAIKRPRTDTSSVQSNALSGLLSAYQVKRVRWADLEGLQEDEQEKMKDDEDKKVHKESPFAKQVNAEHQKFKDLLKTMLQEEAIAEADLVDY